MLVEGVDLEAGTQNTYEMARSAPLHVLKNTVEYHIVYIVTGYSRLLTKAGDRYTWKDVLYTIDVDLPKPRGHIPVHMWAPDGLYEYLAYRVSIDFSGELYPFHIKEGTIRELISNSEEHYRANPCDCKGGLKNIGFWAMLTAGKRIEEIKMAFVGKHVFHNLLTESDEERIIKLSNERMGAMLRDGKDVRNERERVRYIFYALAMWELGIDHGIKGYQWFYVKNPFMAGITDDRCGAQQRP